MARDVNIKITPELVIKRKARRKYEREVSLFISTAINYASKKTAKSVKNVMIALIKETDVQSTRLFRYLAEFVGGSKHGYKLSADKIKKIELDIANRMLSGLKVTNKNVSANNVFNNNQTVVKFELPVYFLPFEDIAKAIEAARAQEQELMIQQINNEISTVVRRRANNARKQGHAKTTKGVLGENLPLPEMMIELRNRARSAVVAIKRIVEVTPGILKSAVEQEVFQILNPNAPTVFYEDLFDDEQSDRGIEITRNDYDEVLKYVPPRNNIQQAKDGIRQTLRELDALIKAIREEVRLTRTAIGAARKDVLNRKFDRGLSQLQQEAILEIEDAIEEDEEIVKELGQQIRDYRKEKIRLLNMMKKDLSSKINIDVYRLFKFLIEEGDTGLGLKVRNLVDEFSAEYLKKNGVQASPISIREKQLPYLDHNTGKVKKLVGPIRPGESRIRTSTVFVNIDREAGITPRPRLVPKSEKDYIAALNKFYRKVLMDQFPDFEENLTSYIQSELDPIRETFLKNTGRIQSLMTNEFRKHFLLYIKSAGGEISTSKGQTTGLDAIKKINAILRRQFNQLANNIESADVDESSFNSIKQNALNFFYKVAEQRASDIFVGIQQGKPYSEIKTIATRSEGVRGPIISEYAKLEEEFYNKYKPEGPGGGLIKEKEYEVVDNQFTVKHRFSQAKQNRLSIVYNRRLDEVKRQDKKNSAGPKREFKAIEEIQNRIAERQLQRAKGQERRTTGESTSIAEQIAPSFNAAARDLGLDTAKAKNLKPDAFGNISISQFFDLRKKDMPQSLGTSKIAIRNYATTTYKEIIATSSKGGIRAGENVRINLVEGIRLPFVRREDFLEEIIRGEIDLTIEEIKEAIAKNEIDLDISNLKNIYINRFIRVSGDKTKNKITTSHFSKIIRTIFLKFYSDRFSDYISKLAIKKGYITLEEYLDTLAI